MHAGMNTPVPLRAAAAAAVEAAAAAGASAPLGARAVDEGLFFIAWKGGCMGGLQSILILTPAAWPCLLLPRGLPRPLLLELALLLRPLLGVIILIDLRGGAWCSGVWDLGSSLDTLPQSIDVRPRPAARRDEKPHPAASPCACCACACTIAMPRSPNRGGCGRLMDARPPMGLCMAPWPWTGPAGLCRPPMPPNAAGGNPAAPRRLQSKEWRAGDLCAAIASAAGLAMFMLRPTVVTAACSCASSAGVAGAYKDDCMASAARSIDWRAALAAARSIDWRATAACSWFCACSWERLLSTAMSSSRPDI